MFAIANAGMYRGLSTRGRAWAHACPKRDGWHHLTPVDRLLERGGKGANWLAATDEIFLLGGDTPESALQGVKGTVTRASVAFVGSMVHGPIVGYGRSEATDAPMASYINLGKTFGDYGHTSSRHGEAMYVTTDYIGNYNECGAAGTAGAKSCNLTGSTGFRSRVRAMSDAAIHGSGNAWGWHAVTRIDANNAIAWRDQAKTFLALLAGSPPLGPIAIGASPPGQPRGFSPNQLAIYVIHHWNEAQGDQAARDFGAYAFETGLRQLSVRPPNVLGDNCYEESAFSSITANPMRVYRQLNYPPYNGAPASITNAHPITDSITRFHTLSNRTIDLTSPTAIVPVGPGSFEAVVTDPTASAPMVEDAVTITGAIDTPAAGLLASDINGRYEIVSVASPTTFTIRLRKQPSAAGVAVGGPGMVAAFNMWRPTASDYIPTRGGLPTAGALHGMLWVNRGTNPPDPQKPFPALINTRGNDVFLTITRQTPGPDGLLAGTQCRTWYTAIPKAMCATETITAIAAGYLPRNDPDDEHGQGYLDIAEAGGFTADKVVSWAHIWSHADTIFTRAQSGFAVCDDYIIKPPRTQLDVGYPVARKRICYDMEVSDFRPVALNSAHMHRCGRIAACKGLKICLVTHVLDDSRMQRNGFDRDSINAIINDPNFETVTIHAGLDVNYPDTIALLDTQWEAIKGKSGTLPVDPSKLLLSGVLGPGKWSILDDTPVGPDQMPVAECARVAQWMRDKHIQHFHTRRFARQEGGTIDLYHQQQIKEYLTGLSASAPVPPPAETPAQAADAHRSAVIALGGTMSDARRDYNMAFVDALQLAGWWNRIEYLGLFASENTFQTRVDLKRRFTGAFGAATAAPVHVPDRYTQFDGTNDEFQTGFIPSSQALFASPANGSLLAFYDAFGGGGGSGSIMGCAHSSNVVQDSLRLNPRTNTPGSVQAILSCTTSVGAVVNTDWRGFLVASRSAGSSQVRVYRNGAPFDTMTAATIGTRLPDRVLRVGSTGTISGTPTAFRACAPAMAIFAGPGTAAEIEVLNAIVDSYLAGIGASVVAPAGRSVDQLFSHGGYGNA